MGSVVSSTFRLLRKRTREDITQTSSPLNVDTVSLLSLTYADGNMPVCRSVVSEGVPRTYGCHHHVYSTISPHASHGVALVWSFPQTPSGSISTLEFLTMCRVANSCRKKTLLLGHPGEPALLLKYTNAL